MKQTRSTRRLKPLWRCPRCGHRFVTPNLSHSCGRFRLSTHFAGKQPALKKTFDRFADLARKCGKVTVYAQKTRIVIQARVRFASAIVRKDWLDAALWLKHRATHPSLARVEDFGSLGFYHHFRLTSPSDLDAPLEKLIAQAYQV